MKKSSNSQIAGVCAGLAEHFDIEPFWVRLAFVLAFLFWGVGVISYLILWVIMD